MPTMTLSPHARIGALIGVLLIALVVSALYVLQGNSQPTTLTTPTVQHQPTHHHVKVVVPKVNPLLPDRVRIPLEHSPLVVAGFFNPHAKVQGLAMDEAQAGAREAH